MLNLSSQLLIGGMLGGFVGLVMALTGAGGGVLAVPLLIFVLHLSVQQAAPIALLAVAAAAVFGALLGLREGIVRYRAAALIGTLAMLTAPLGVWLAQRLPGRSLMLAFALILAWTSWRMVKVSLAAASSPGQPRPAHHHPCNIDPGDGRIQWTAPCARVLGSTGVVAGLLSGLLGVGGGFIIVPALTRYTDLDVRSIAATSLAVIAMASTSGLLASHGQGQLDWSLAGSFAASAVLALWVGRRFAKSLPPALLQRGFAALSAVVALLMLARGMGWISN